MTSSQAASAAAAVGLAVLLVSGGVYRAAERRLANLPAATLIPAGTLLTIPKELNDWRGTEVPLEERIVTATGTDDHLNRMYRKGGQRVFLWIAYGVRLRDLFPHRPEVCYIGAGWLLDDTRDVVLTAADGRSLPCRMQHFRRGGLQADERTVLSYFLVGGQYSADVELLRRAAWRSGTEGRYSVQVQVSCPGPFREQAASLVQNFAVVASPRIREVLESAVARSEVEH